MRAAFSGTDWGRRARTLPVAALLSLGACWPPSASAATQLGEARVGSVEVAFSPDQGAEQLVIRALDSARAEVRMLAYTFTSATVTNALLRARARGVDVALVVDAQQTLAIDRSGRARQALTALARAGAHVRLVSVFLDAHDKCAVIDRATVQSGSFNYSWAAAHRNSENVIVFWASPEIAAQYLGHFERSWDQARPFSPDE